jgi:PKD repeat protein
VLRLITVLLACLAFAAGCGSGSQQSSSPSTDPAAAPSAPDALLAGAPAAALPGLPADLPLSHSELAPRLGTLLSTLQQDGSAAWQLGPGAAADSVTGTAQALSSAGSLSYVLYRFDNLLPEDLPGALTIEFAAPLPAESYIALPDYAAGRWTLTALDGLQSQQSIGLAPDRGLLSPAGTLYIAVVVYDGSGASLRRIAVVLDSDAPPPLELAAVRDDSLVNTITWEDPALSFDPDGDGPAAFEYAAVEVQFRGEDTEQWLDLGSYPVGTTTTEKPGVVADDPPFGPFYFRARTRYSLDPGAAGGGAGPWSGAVFGSGGGLDMVTSFAADDERTDGVMLTWDPVPGASEYWVYLSVDQGPVQLLATGLTGGSFLHSPYTPAATPVVPLTSLDYGIRAVSGERFGRLSRATAYWLGPEGPWVRATTDLPGMVRLSWDPVPYAGTYSIYWREVGAPGPRMFKVGGVTVTWFEHSLTAPVGDELKPNTQYEYQVLSDGPEGISEDGPFVTIGSGAPMLEARLEWLPSSGQAPLVVDFDAGITVVEAGQVIEHFLWDFDGNGTLDLDSGDDPSVSHTYEAAIEATCVVRAVQTNGDFSITRGRVVVTPPPTLLQARLTATPVNGALPLEVLLDASGSEAGSGETITSYQWDFDGDGSYELDSGADAAVTHVYTTAGTLLPGVLVTQTGGAQSTAATSVLPGGWVHSWGGALDDIAVPINNGIAVAADGSTFVSGWQEDTENLLLFKLGPGGEPLWVRAWDAGARIYGNVGLAALNDGSVALMMLYYSEASPAGLDEGPVLLHFSGAGDLLSQRIWRTDSAEFRFGWELVSDGSSTYLLADTTQLRAFLLKFDSQLEPVWQREVTGVRPWLCLNLDAQQNPVLAGRSATAETAARIARFDQDGNVVSALALEFEAREDHWVKPKDIEFRADGTLAVLADHESFSGPSTTRVTAVINGGSLLWASGFDTSWPLGLQDLLWDDAGNLLQLPEMNRLITLDGSSGAVLRSLRFDRRVENFRLDAAGDLLLAGAAPYADVALTAQPFTYQPYNLTVGAASDVTTAPAAGHFEALSGVVSVPPGVWDTGGGGQDALFMKLPQ